MGSRDLVLYLDFDGVLHHSQVAWSPQIGPYLAAPARYTLFQHADLLAQLLEPWPHVKIVLTTTWAYRYGLDYSVARLPPGLCSRVVGTIYAQGLKYPDDFARMPRGMQVAGDAATRKPGRWIALDDDDEGWPREHRHRLIKTHMYEGLNKPGVIKQLNAKLAEMHE